MRVRCIILPTPREISSDMPSKKKRLMNSLAEWYQDPLSSVGKQHSEMGDVVSRELEGTVYTVKGTRRLTVIGSVMTG